MNSNEVNMGQVGNAAEYTSATLVVDGLDEQGNFAGDGQRAPFVVFDADSQANIAGPFLARNQAEQHRLEILAGKPPRLDVKALGQALTEEDQGKVEFAKDSMNQKQRAAHEQLTLTLDVTFMNGAPKDMESMVSWASSCLNASPEHAEVKITNPTGLLCWPDFLDAPGFGPEHPDYADSVEDLRKVEAWLQMDRQQLIAELLAQHARMPRPEAAVDDSPSPGM